VLDRLKNWRFRRALRDGMRKKKHPASGQGVNLDTARSVSILFDATQVDERKVVTDFARQLQHKGTTVRLLGYFTTDIGESTFAFPAFTRQDLNWYGVPKKQPAVDDFLRAETDLLLVLQAQATPLFDYLAALTPAAFKVGPVSYTTPAYDVMLDVPAKADHRYLIQQIQQVLKVTNAPLQPA
jgi:hypothetical protein